MLIKVNEVTLYYQVIGRGKPLILLHGNGESSKIFKELTADLKKHFKVYLIDSRNHGHSQVTDCYDYTVMAEDIKAFIIELELNQPGLFGFSDGGIIGLILASTYPDLLSHLFISGANLHPKGILRKSLKDLKKTYKKTKNPLINLMIAQPSIPKEQLQSITIPTIVCAGEHDVIKYHHTKKIHQYIDNSQLLIMKGHDHSNYIEHKTILSPYFIDFFLVKNLLDKSEKKT